MCVCVCMYICMYVSMYVFMYVCMNVCMYLCMYVFLFVCMYICVYEYMSLCVCILYIQESLRWPYLKADLSMLAFRLISVMVRPELLWKQAGISFTWCQYYKTFFPFSLGMWTVFTTLHFLCNLRLGQ